MSYMEDLLVSKTACFGFIGIRGSSKSWSSQYILEALSEHGWKPLLIDSKGEDETIHLPASGIQAMRLSSFGLKPKGFSTKYLTFRFPIGMENVPISYTLEPISIKMLSYGHFRTLGGFFSEGESRELFDAYLSAGGSNAKLEDVITSLLRKKGDKASPRVLSFLVTLFDDKSLFEPEKLLDIINKYDFTVVSTGYFKPSSRDLALFSLNVVLDNLASHLIQMVTSAKMIVHFRELREVAPREGAIGSQWHLRERISHFITFLRQTRTAVTRVSFEVQNVKSVPKVILDNSHGVFVHPFNLREVSQRKELEKYFPIPENIIRSATALESTSYGTWIYISKDGHAEYVTIPPPRSLRIPEPTNNGKELVTFYSSISPRRSLESEANEVRRLYKYWMSRAKLLREEGKREKISLADPGLPPPTIVPRYYISKQLAGVAVFCYLFANEEKDTFSPLEVWRWYVSLVGQAKGRILVPAYINDAMRRVKNQTYLRVLGIKLFEDGSGRYFFKVEDRERLRAHMKKYIDHYLKKLGLTKGAVLTSNYEEGEIILGGRWYHEGQRNFV